MAKKTIQIDDGLMSFEFTNKTGDVIASFKINPTDVHLIERCQTVAQQFADLQRDVPEGAEIDEVARYDEKLRQMFDYLLDYDASETLFMKPMTPTTVLPNGTIFAVLVMDTIIDMVEPEIQKRQANMQKSMDKYLAKYR